MRIVVLGVTGMLGHKVFQALRERFPGTVGTTRADLSRPPFDAVDFLQGHDVIRGVDVSNFARLQGVLEEIRPDFIVNCIGIIKQSPAAKEAVPSIMINALLPHKLVTFAEKWGGGVIHPSTDCVFSGKRGRYIEEDVPDADDLYGRSKLLGELLYDNALTLRTSIIGRELAEHRGLLDWFLSQRGKTVRGFKRVIYSGLTTIELANVLTLIIRKFPDLTGLYQVVSEPISKYDLLCLVKEAFDLDIGILPDEAEVSDRSMKGEKFKMTTGYVVPQWTALIRGVAQDPTPYARWIK